MRSDPMSPRPERIVPPAPQVDTTPDPRTSTEYGKPAKEKAARPEPTLPVKIFGWTLLTIIFVVVILAALAGAVKVIELLWAWIH